jgi:hypothetical protein
VSLEKRIEEAEEKLKPEEAGRDLLITVHTEQHVHVGDELVLVKREPTSYTEVKWSEPDKSGRRIGVRYARYIDEGDDPGNWNQNIPKTLSADAGEPDANHSIVLDPEVTGN